MTCPDCGHALGDHRQPWGEPRECPEPCYCGRLIQGV